MSLSSLCSGLAICPSGPSRVWPVTAPNQDAPPPAARRLRVAYSSIDRWDSYSAAVTVPCQVQPWLLMSGSGMP